VTRRHGCNLRTMTAPIGQQAQHAWLASLFDITG
jgi:hypothetical protein